jgi:hypothetical protein
MVLCKGEWSENVAKFKHLGDINKQNYVHEKIKDRLNSGNAYYVSVQKLSSV